jgi:hypothetical protein
VPRVVDREDEVGLLEEGLTHEQSGQAAVVGDVGEEVRARPRRRQHASRRSHALRPRRELAQWAGLGGELALAVLPHEVGVHDGLVRQRLALAGQARVLDDRELAAGERRGLDALQMDVLFLEQPVPFYVRLGRVEPGRKARHENVFWRHGGVEEALVGGFVGEDEVELVEGPVGMQKRRKAADKTLPGRSGVDVSCIGVGLPVQLVCLSLARLALIGGSVGSVGFVCFGDQTYRVMTGMADSRSFFGGGMTWAWWLEWEGV